MKLILLFACSLGLLSNVWAFDHQYKDYNQLLKLVVLENQTTSSVNYQLLVQKKSELQKVVDQFEQFSLTEFQSSNEKQRLSFLINAYNLYTLKLITDNYPIKSIKDTGSLFSSPWKKKIFKLFSEIISLDHIEHELIRKNFNEARIHFAVNCASIGCPALLAEAFEADKLESQLARSVAKFLGDNSRNRYESSENVFFISPIFKWYREDFEKSKGSLLNFLKDYYPEFKKESAEIEFNDYDWNLNKQ